MEIIIDGMPITTVQNINTKNNFLNTYINSKSNNLNIHNNMYIITVGNPIKTPTVIELSSLKMIPNKHMTIAEPSIIIKSILSATSAFFYENPSISGCNPEQKTCANVFEIAGTRYSLIVLGGSLLCISAIAKKNMNHNTIDV